MIIIDGIELEFDITSPADVQRYKQAGERMEEAGREIVMPEMAMDDPNFLNEYVAMLNKQLNIYAAFLDEIFGDGIAEKLLGNNPSLTKITQVNDAIANAMQLQGSDIGGKLSDYAPSRIVNKIGIVQ